MTYRLTGNCLHCKKEFAYSSHQSMGKYCSSGCMGIHKTTINEQLFWEGKVVERETARKYLANKYGYRCSICGIADWQGKNLTLHVDHINGDPGNSHHSNLRLLCPNCHSQTPFLGNGNKGRGRGALGISRK